VTILVLGGRSEIGLAVARRLATGTIVLAARRSAELDGQPLLDAGASAVERVEFDADDLASHGAVLGDIVDRFGPLDVVITAFGILGEQARAEREAGHAVSIVHTD
jgi:NAD(P)-dependent dehydrogenase (short-subunit alcohol dehydrogenase family)